MTGMSRPLRIGVIALGAVLLLAVAGWFLVGYSVRRAFSKTSFEPLETITKAAASDIVVIRQKGKETPPLVESYAATYERDPAKVEANAKFSEAWFAAGSLADAVFENGPNGNWVQRADELPAAVVGNRTDPWGHPFCLLRRDDVVVVLSAGPAAQAAPTCKDIPVKASALAQLPRGRMIETPRGALLLTAEQKPQGLKPSPK